MLQSRTIGAPELSPSSDQLTYFATVEGPQPLQAQSEPGRIDIELIERRSLTVTIGGLAGEPAGEGLIMSEDRAIPLCAATTRCHHPRAERAGIGVVAGQWRAVAAIFFEIAAP